MKRFGSDRLAIHTPSGTTIGVNRVGGALGGRPHFLSIRQSGG